MLMYVLLCLLIFCWLWARCSLYKVKLQRSAGAERLQVGEVFEEGLVLENGSWLPKLWVQITDGGTLPGHQVGYVTSLGSRKRARWQGKSVCRHRGRFQLGPVTASGGDPFGLFRRKRVIAPAREVLVLPRVQKIDHLELPSAGLPEGGRNALRALQATVSATTVRPYVTGDPLNRLHWPSTARHNMLMVKEFEQQPTIGAWIVLDLNQVEKAKKGERAMEERKVTMAASLAYHLLRRQFAVGLVINGEREEVLPLGRGDRQLDQILELLALAKGSSGPQLQEFQSQLGFSQPIAPSAVLRRYQLPIAGENLSCDCLLLPDKRSVAFCHFSDKW